MQYPLVATFFLAKIITESSFGVQTQSLSKPARVVLECAKGSGLREILGKVSQKINKILYMQIAHFGS